MRYDYVGQVEQLAPAVPAGQAEEGVHPEQQTQRALRVLAAQLGERVDRVRHAGAAHFAVVDHEARLIGDRRLDHLQAQLRGRVQMIAVRGTAGRQEAHLGEPELLPQLERGAQMPTVDRIEGAAEEADGLLHGGRCATQAQRARVRSVSSSQALPVTRPLITRSTRAARAARSVKAMCGARRRACSSAALWRCQPRGAPPAPVSAPQASCNALVSAHSTSVGSEPSARSPASTRSARAAAPLNTAAESWKT